MCTKPASRRPLAALATLTGLLWLAFGSLAAVPAFAQQMPDDTPETQKHRITVYFEQTAPLIDYYQEKGLLVEVDGRPGIDEIQAELLDIIRGL
jgi:adenylate kinase family enzyme